MKIGLVSPYDFSYPGGVNNHIVALEKQLTKMGHEVKIIAPASEHVKSDDGKFIRLGTPRSMPVGGTTIRISISLNLAPEICKILEREKFDIIHLHEPFMVMVCSAILRYSKAINIGTFHATKGKPGYNWGWPITPWLLKRRCRNLSGKIAVSPPAKNYASNYVPGEFEIIPNGIDLEQFNQGVKPIEKFQDGKINILFVGRLEKRKGLKYLIKACGIAQKQFEDIRLIVVGPGTRFRKKYEQQAADEKLKNVEFIGAVSDEDLPRYYKTADIFCAPATGQESFGIVLLEGMALGKPVIASDIEGYASVLTHNKEGLLFPPKDSKKLAEALIKLISSKELREKMGKKGLSTADHYSWERVAKRVNAFYQEVCNKKQSMGEKAQEENLDLDTASVQT